MKVHLFKHVQEAYDAWHSGTTQRDVALNQTECGYVRDNVTTSKRLVTCKLCLRKLNKGNR